MLQHAEPVLELNCGALIEPEEAFPYMFEAIRILKRELKVPLIGFAGAPFTLASYMIEGGHSRNFDKAKVFMWEQPAAWKSLAFPYQLCLGTTVAFLTCVAAKGQGGRTDHPARS